MYKHILLPVAMDHNPHSGKAMNVARALAGEDGKITALHVIEDIPGYVELHIPDEIQAANVEKAKSAVKNVIAGHPKADAKVLRGHAAQSILEFAKGVSDT